MMEKELPDGWVLTELEKVAQWGSGGTPSRADSTYYGGTIPWIKTGDLNDGLVTDVDEYITERAVKNSSAKIFPKGSIGVAMYGATIGKTGVFGMDAATNQACAVAQVYENVESRLLHYYLKSQKEAFVEKGKGGAQPNISQTVIKAHPFPLPPLAEQKRIVAKLDMAFGYLETLKANLARIQELLRTFRQSVLTQAVTGNPKFKIETLGSNLVDIKYGTSQKSERETEGIPILRIPNIVNGEIDSSDLKYSLLDSAEYEKLKLRIGDVLMIRSNGSVSIVGQSAIVREDHVNWAYAGYLIRLRTKKELDPVYLNLVLKTNFLRGQIVEMARSTTGVNNINTDEIKRLKIPIPSIEEQQKIILHVKGLFSQADAIESQYISLKEKIDKLPQALLTKAFRGELVPQDSEDEPASLLLGKIKEQNEKSASKSQKLVVPKHIDQEMSDKQTLLELLESKFDDIPFSFDEITLLTNQNYEELKEEIFGLLDAKKKLTMIFNEADGHMKFKIISNETQKN